MAQFCAVIGRESLFEQARSRARLLIAPARTLLVLTRAHDRFYAPLLQDAQPGTVIVQPLARGTAPAILYGLLRIAAVSQTAKVVILPSDHYVSDDARLMAHVASAFAAVDRHPDRVVLLGMEPDTAETEYGWIEPGDGLPGSDLRGVRRFWEAFLGSIRRTLLALDDAFLPIRAAVSTAAEADAAQEVYARLSPLDFSVEVLARNAVHLAVLPVTGINWTDLGQPRRVLAVLRALGSHPAWAGEPEAESA